MNYSIKFLNLGAADDEYLSRQKRDDNHQQFRNKRLTTRLVGDVEVVVQGNYIKMNYGKSFNLYFSKYKRQP